MRLRKARDAAAERMHAATHGGAMFDEDAVRLAFSGFDLDIDEFNEVVSEAVSQTLSRFQTLGQDNAITTVPALIAGVWISGLLVGLLDRTLGEDPPARLDPPEESDLVDVRKALRADEITTAQVDLHDGWVFTINGRVGEEDKRASVTVLTRIGGLATMIAEMHALAARAGRLGELHALIEDAWCHTHPAPRERFAEFALRLREEFETKLDSDRDVDNLLRGYGIDAAEVDRLADLGWPCLGHMSIGFAIGAAWAQRS